MMLRHLYSNLLCNNTSWLKLRLKQKGQLVYEHAHEQQRGPPYCRNTSVKNNTQPLRFVTFHKFSCGCLSILVSYCQQPVAFHTGFVRSEAPSHRSCILQEGGMENWIFVKRPWIQHTTTGAFWGIINRIRFLCFSNDS